MSTLSGSLPALKDLIRDIPDFPKEGIIFRDITPLLLDKVQFKASIDHFRSLTPTGVDVVVSIESRGFIFGSALAYALGAGFVPVRKQGKLPYKTFAMAYDLEYGKASIEIHEDAIKRGAKVILVDDVLATGGTVEAAVKLVSRFDAQIVGAYFLIELLALGGRKKLGGTPVHSLVTY